MICNVNKYFLTSFVGMMILSLSLSACKDLDKLMDMSDLDEMKRRMLQELAADSLKHEIGDEKITVCNDTTFYVNTPNDSAKQEGMTVVIKKVRLENHDYWLTVGVGVDKGGLAIVHSESCPH